MCCEKLVIITNPSNVECQTFCFFVVLQADDTPLTPPEVPLTLTDQLTNLLSDVRDMPTLLSLDLSPLDIAALRQESTISKKVGL